MQFSLRHTRPQATQKILIRLEYYTILYTDCESKIRHKLQLYHKLIKYIFLKQFVQDKSRLCCGLPAGSLREHLENSAGIVLLPSNQVKCYLQPVLQCK